MPETIPEETGTEEQVEEVVEQEPVDEMEEKAYFGIDGDVRVADLLPKYVRRGSVLIEDPSDMRHYL